MKRKLKVSEPYLKVSAPYCDTYTALGGDGELVTLSNDWSTLVHSTAGAPYLDKDALIEEIMRRFNKAPVLEHKCNNCGAVLKIDSNKHIFHCEYCGAAYAIGTSMINDRG